jgi:hypothetical protein
MDEQMKKARELKQYIIEAWEKRRVPSRIKKRAECYEYSYCNGESYVIGCIQPFLIEVWYNKEWICGYIDLLTDRQVNIIKNGGMMFIRAKNIERFEIKKT